MRLKAWKSWKGLNKKGITAAIAMTLCSASVTPAYALPTDGKVISGDAAISSSGDIMTIKQTGDRAAIDWASFNINSNETVNFEQNAQAVALNRVVGINNVIDASKIEGKLYADGTVFLINPSGVIFGKGAMVDVGGLVASTGKVSDADMKNFADTGKFTATIAQDSTAKITNETVIRAAKNEGGLVVLHASNVENKDTITANGGNVDIAAVQTMNYADGKVTFDVPKSALKQAKVLNEGTIAAQNGDIVLTARGASNVVASVVNSDKAKLEATNLTKDAEGQWVLGNGGMIRTAADYVQVKNGAEIKAGSETANGTWEVNSTTVVKVQNAGSVNGSTVSNKAVSKALDNHTNVVITANAKQDKAHHDYAADIQVNGAITKTAGKDASLTLNAGRNIVIDADITSTKGVLDVTAIATQQRGDGANILRANVATNGGNLTFGESVDGAVKGGNTYIGLTDKELAEAKKGKDIGRNITTEGGNITVHGDVIVATAGTTTVNTMQKNGKLSGDVTIDGTLNSGNAYSFASSNDTYNWLDAQKAASGIGDGKAVWATYLATITSKLEDSVVSATIPTLGRESYVGGRVVQVKTNEKGEVIYQNGKPVIEKTDADLVDNGTPGSKLDTIGGGWVKSGKYDKDGKPEYVRYWAWVTGPEAGTIICKQTTGEWLLGKDMNNDTGANGYMTQTNHSTAMDTSIYTNFAPGEPNDDNGDGVHQTYLAVNYNTFKDSEKASVLYSQWDDVIGVCKARAQKINSYVVETNLPESSLAINSNNITLNGAVGDTKELRNLTINADGAVETNATIKLTNDLNIQAKEAIIVNKDIHTGDDITLRVTGMDEHNKTSVEGKNIVINDTVNAGDKMEIISDQQGVLSKGYLSAGWVRGTKTDSIIEPEAGTEKLGDGSIHERTNMDLFITTKGDIETKRSIEARNGIAIKSTEGSLVTDALVNGGYYTKLTAEKDITASGLVNAGRYVTLTSETGNIKTADIKNSQFDITINAKKGNVETNGTITADELSNGNQKNGNVYITAGKNITTNKVVTATQSIIMKPGTNVVTKDALNAGKDVTLHAGAEVVTMGTVRADEGNVELKAGGSVTTEGIESHNSLVRLVSTGDDTITLNNKISTGATDTKGAVVIKTGGSFVNNAGADAVTTGEGSTWNIYSNAPEKDTFGGLNSNNRAQWGWDKTSAADMVVEGNSYIFAYQPTLTVTANNATKTYGTVGTDNGYMITNELYGQPYEDAFTDVMFGPTSFTKGYALWDSLGDVDLTSDGFAADAAVGFYSIREDALGGRVTDHGYKVVAQPGTLEVLALTPTTTTTVAFPGTTQPDLSEVVDGEIYKPLLEMKATSNADGTAGYTLNNGRGIAGVDRVAGLQDAQFPFFRVAEGKKQFYGAFEVAADPDQVKLTPSDKVLPEPPEIENQYRELTKTLTTEKGASAAFKLTYNGSRFQIIPTDKAGMDILKAGDNDKNADIASKALFTAFNEMGLALEDLDSIYVHLDNGSF